MYLRFVITQLDEDSRLPTGLFTVAYDLLDRARFADGDGLRVRHFLNWCSDNLPTPPKTFVAGRAVFWFKSSGSEAKECIERMWELTSLIRECGYHVEVHKCRKLANICYEDKFQVAAYPSAKDARVTIS